MRGDITPFYLFHSAAPARIRSVLPNARLVALLRDPVERTLSQYFHARRLGYEHLDLEAALDAEDDRIRGADSVVNSPSGFHYGYQKHSYVSRSRYEEQLRRYFRYFPRRQLLIIRSEDIFNQIHKCWDPLLQFIEADSLSLPEALPHSNQQGEAARRFLPRLN